MHYSLGELMALTADAALLVQLRPTWKVSLDGSAEGPLPRPTGTETEGRDVQEVYQVHVCQ
jgi:hypothetical protein